MKRQLHFAIGALWLTVTSVWAPFAHMHPGDPGHHHGNGFAHPHLAVHHEAHHEESESPEIEPDDHDAAAVWTDWAPTIPPRLDLVAAVESVHLHLAPTFLPVGVAPLLTVRSHDPPGLPQLPGRSPPL
jgi:hypothetical protein